MLGFAVAGEDGKFQPAIASYKVLKEAKGRRQPAVYDRKTIVLSSPLVSKPVHYRYAWARSPLANMRLSMKFGNDVMLPTQRSDSWTNADLLKSLTGKTAVDPGMLDRREARSLSMALEKEDERRRLYNANTIVEKTGAAAQN